MNPREAINFAKSPTGAFLAFCLLIAVAFFLFRGFRHPIQSPSKPVSLVAQAAAAEAKSQTVQSAENQNYSAFRPPPPQNDKPIEPLVVKTNHEAADILPISLFPDNPEPGKKQISKLYAPYGRLISCELIITVDSSSIRTPIVGLVTDDIYHGGRLIIPAGTEVHGMAQVDRNRERIASATRWTLVWQTGEELKLSGIALDREKDGDSEGWGITDGSAGLRGRLIKTDNMAEIKLFAAAFLSGAAGLFSDRQFTIFGSQTSPTLENAPLTGAQTVLQAYSQQIYDSIRRDGFYVRVPAGKQFYLYVTQTIDGSDATIGGSHSDVGEVDDATNQLPSILPIQRYTVPESASTRPGAFP
jgi:hypothetical protein